MERLRKEIKDANEEVFQKENELRQIEEQNSLLKRLDAEQRRELAIAEEQVQKLEEQLKNTVQRAQFNNIKQQKQEVEEKLAECIKSNLKTQLTINQLKAENERLKSEKTQSQSETQTQSQGEDEKVDEANQALRVKE